MNQEFREIHTTWLQRREEEQRSASVPDVPEGDVNTPVALTPHDLPAAHDDVDAAPPILHDVVSLSILQDVEYPPEIFAGIPAAAVSSPTLSISTVSDLTPTELGEDIEDSMSEQTLTRHDTFYFEDGNVEVVCGDTIFRVHSTTISFSSPKLRDILSPSTLLRAPTPEGHPRITVGDIAQDFAVLLKMIYTPGRVSLPAGVGSVN